MSFYDIIQLGLDFKAKSCLAKPVFPVSGSPEPIWDDANTELLAQFYQNVGSGAASQEKRPYIPDVREELVLRILTVLDGLDRIIKLAEENVSSDDKVLNNWLASIKGTYKNLFKVLQKEGLSQIETVGLKADFNYHEVIDIEERDDVEPGIILAEEEPGYTFKDRVLRAAKVIVAKSQSKEVN